MKAPVCKLGFNTIGELIARLEGINRLYDVGDSAVTDFAGVTYTAFQVVRETLTDGSEVFNVVLVAQ